MKYLLQIQDQRMSTQPCNRHSPEPHCPRDSTATLIHLEDLQHSRPLCLFPDLSRPEHHRQIVVVVQFSQVQNKFLHSGPVPFDLGPGETMRSVQFDVVVLCGLDLESAKGMLLSP